MVSYRCRKNEVRPQKVAKARACTGAQIPWFSPTAGLTLCCFSVAAAASVCSAFASHPLSVSVAIFSIYILCIVAQLLRLFLPHFSFSQFSAFPQSFRCYPPNNDPSFFLILSFSYFTLFIFLIFFFLAPFYVQPLCNPEPCSLLFLNCFHPILRLTLLCWSLHISMRSSSLSLLLSLSSLHIFSGFSFFAVAAIPLLLFLLPPNPRRGVLMCQGLEGSVEILASLRRNPAPERHALQSLSMISTRTGSSSTCCRTAGFFSILRCSLTVEPPCRPRQP